MLSTTASNNMVGITSTVCDHLHPSHQGQNYLCKVGTFEECFCLMLNDKNAIKMWNIKHYFVTCLLKKKGTEHVENIYFLIYKFRAYVNLLLAKAQVTC